MKTRKLLVITSLALVALLVTAGVVFALGIDAVNQGIDSTAEGDFSTVSGGGNNNIPAEGDFATIGGGENNTAERNHDTVGGGSGNTANGFSVDSESIGFATVARGQNNTADGRSSTVSGGFANTASGLFSTVSGGAENAPVAPTPPLPEAILTPPAARNPLSAGAYSTPLVATLAQ